MLITSEHFKRIYKENKVEVTCLVLIINNDCNADCRACIAQHVFKGSLCKEICEAYETCKHLRCCDHTATDEEFYSRLEEILQTVNSPIVDIIITGGEPTISNRFVPTLELIAKYNYPIKNLQLETNGAMLADEAVIEAIKKYKVQIHLSRYGKTDEENQAEFRYKSYATSNEDIKGFAEIYGNQLGISTVILKDHISSGKELLEMIDASEKLGVHHHDFLEVMADTTLETANPEMLAYYKEQLVTAEQLRKELKELGVVETRTSMDESYGISYHDYNGVKFTITYSKLDKQHKQETHNLFSRFLIMPSGEIGVNGIEKR